MPIDFQFAPSSLSMDEMRELDYMVMSQAHASQNELGRLCDEKIYQADLTERLRERGLQNSYRGVPLKASYEDFSMTYFLDLVVEGQAIYELLGGDLAVSKSLPLTRGKTLLGYQSFNLYSHNAAFPITSFPKLLTLTS